MYRCSDCGKVVPAGTARLLRIIYKDFVHPHRHNAGKKWGVVYGKLKLEWFDDPGGAGKQIAREIPVCASCKGDGTT